MFMERIPEFIMDIEYKKDREPKRDYWTEGTENKTGIKRDFTCGETGKKVEFEKDKKRALKTKGEGYTEGNVDIYEIP